MPAARTFRLANRGKTPHVRRHQTDLRPHLGGADVRGDEPSIGVRINAFQVVVCWRAGAGGRPGHCRMCPTVWSLMRGPQGCRVPAMRSSPRERCPGARRLTKVASVFSTVGQPNAWHSWEPSRFCAMSVRGQASMVFDLPMLATSSSAFGPHRLPSAASAFGSPSLNCTWPYIWLRGIRFSATR
jgi:hypothetical protein